jgi:undecaprenyl-diphosphatase
MLLVYGLILGFISLVLDPKKLTLSIHQLSWFGFLAIGFAQGISALPGISRLGLTLVTALLLGLAWKEALILSFLLSLPTLFFANLYTFLFNGNAAFHSDWTMPYLILAFVLSFAAGLVAFRQIERFFNGKMLLFFGLYCVAVGAFFFLYAP